MFFTKSFHGILDHRFRQAINHLDELTGDDVSESLLKIYFKIKIGK